VSIDRDLGLDFIGYPAWIRVFFCAIVSALGLFGLCTVVFNLPESTVKSRVSPVINAVMEPWFDQDWHLFAPTPATSNSQLMVSAQLRSSDGSIVEMPAFDVQEPLEDLAKTNHFLPTNLPMITLAARQQMSQYARELADIMGGPPAGRDEMHAELDHRYQDTLDQLRRFMSRCAQDRFGAAHIVAVRGTFTETPVTPFSKRDETNPPSLPTKTIVTTSWAPFVADVGK